MLAIWAVVLGASCGAPEDLDGDAGERDAHADAGPTAPRFPPCDPSARLQTITFVHVNDMHGTFHPDGDDSPPGRLRGYFEKVRQENPFTLFTNAGDDHEKGWLAEQRSEGQATVELVRAMGFDVRMLGNHDFAWGPAGVLAHSQDPHSIVLASNVRWIGPEPESFGAVHFGTIEVGCLKVGFFGLLSKPWDERNEQYTGPYLPGYDDTRYDFVSIADSIVSKRRDEVDLLVMVSHLGLELDEHLAQCVYGIDLILSGHSHDVLHSPVNSNGALIVQAGAYARQAFRLDLDMDLVTGRRVARRFALVDNLPGELRAAPQVEAKVRELMGRWAPDANLPVTFVAHARSELGVAELASQAAVRVHAADAALVDSWEVWTGFEPGPLSPQQILDAFKIERAPSGTPGFSSFYLVSISGMDLGHLAADLGPSRWALSTVEGLSPEGTYQLVLQKHVAFHPRDYLPGGVTLLGAPLPLEEVWATVHSFALGRSTECMHLDTDDPLPRCP